jgi:hypothetical protein
MHPHTRNGLLVAVPLLALMVCGAIGAAVEAVRDGDDEPTAPARVVTVPSTPAPSIPGTPSVAAPDATSQPPTSQPPVAVPPADPPADNGGGNGDGGSGGDVGDVKDRYYANCAAAKAAGAAPLRRGQDDGYRRALDRDNDGIACDK